MICIPERPESLLMMMVRSIMEKKLSMVLVSIKGSSNLEHVDQRCVILTSKQCRGPFRFSQSISFTRELFDNAIKILTCLFW